MSFREGMAWDMMKWVGMVCLCAMVPISTRNSSTGLIKFVRSEALTN